jgi:hypothetical protein
MPPFRAYRIKKSTNGKNRFLKSLKNKNHRKGSFYLEEGGGFEPPVGCPTIVFKTIPFNRSGIPPKF